MHLAMRMPRAPDITFTLSPDFKKVTLHRHLRH